MTVTDGDLSDEPRTVLESAVVLVLDSARRALIVATNTYGGYGLPGGKREPEDLNIVHTAVREMQEEVALVVDPAALALVYKAPARFRLIDGDIGPTREVHLFRAWSVRGRARATESDRPIAWVNWAAFIESTPAFREFYEKAIPYGFAGISPTRMVAL